MDRESNSQDKINILTKLLWFCSGANSEILKKSVTDRGKYATQGFAILLITIVGGFGGGYAISTVFTSRLVVYGGGALWGLVLGSMDRAMVSSFTKKTNSSWTEKIGDGVSLVVKLGISTLISLTVAKPLEVRMFKNSINAQIAKNIEREFVRESEKVNAKFDPQIKQIEQEKNQNIQEKKELDLQIKKDRETIAKEISKGNGGRKRGRGDIAKALEANLIPIVNDSEDLEAKIQNQTQSIEILRADKQKKLEKLENKIKQERTANDFVAQLHVLYQIQQEELKIFFGGKLGVYEATGWAITLLFILIDTSPVLIKIFSRIDNYEKLLEKAQEKEEISEKKILEDEYEMFNHTNNILINEKKQLIQELLEEKKNEKKELNKLKSQETDLVWIYRQKCLELALKKIDSADRLSQLRRIRNQYKKTDFNKNNLAFSLEEELDRIDLSLNNFRNNVKNIGDNRLDFSKLERLQKAFHKRSQKKKKAKKKPLINAIKKIGGFFVISCGVWISLETIALSSLKIKSMPFPEEANPHIVYTADGQELKNPRSWKDSARELELEEFSIHVINALIASEDRRFYSHPGIDPKGLVRALVQNLKEMDIVEGGSTLSQQLAKTLFLAKEPDSNKLQHFRKKVRQIILAIRLEAEYDKDTILKTYLNRIYLSNQKGRPIIGFEEAAQFFFGKSARDLNIAESATLVAILPSPNDYEPINNLDRAKKQRNISIRQMLDLEMITKQEAIEALESKIEIKTQDSIYPETFAPYAYDRVMSELETILGKDKATSGQFIIEITLNRLYQQVGKETLKKELETRGATKGYDEAALVTIDRKTGAILALIGGMGAKLPY